MHIAAVHVCYPMLPKSKKGVIQCPIGVLIVPHLAEKLPEEELEPLTTHGWEVYRPATGEMIVRKRITVRYPKQRKVPCRVAWDIAAKIQLILRTLELNGKVAVQGPLETVNFAAQFLRFTN